MTAAQAMAKVFFQAFKSLSQKEKDQFLDELLKEKEYRQDLIDIALLEARRHESGRPFRDYLAERHKQKQNIERYP